MKNTAIAFLSIFFLSCRFSSFYNTCDYLGSNKVATDTTVIYDIEGISTEGTEAKVHYTNARIESSVVHIYSSTCQIIINYKFKSDKIEVSETKYSYKKELSDIKSFEDMQQDYTIKYHIDFEGNILGNIAFDRTDIFQEFKKIVPFEIECNNY